MCLMCLLSYQSASAQDSIPVTELAEITVKAKRGWIEKDKIVYIPSKSEKKLSNSPATLIESMHLPMLKVHYEDISTISGEPVSIFINGQKADPATLAAFWPSNALRVEYLENPTDPAFLGAPRVVNFIMREYEVGGNTSLEYTQRIPNAGTGEISSQMAYRRLTLGVMLSGHYDNDHGQTQQTSVTYSDLFYKGDYYENLNNTERTPVHRKGEYVVGALSAQLKWEKFTATHNFSWEWQKVNSGSETTNSWDPMIFNSRFSSAGDKSRNNSLSVGGMYLYNFNPKWSMAWGWSYRHSHTSANSFHQTSEMPVIYNSVSEDADALWLRIMSTYRHSGILQFQISVSSSETWYSTRYEGTTQADSPFSRNETSGDLLCYWRPFDKISFNLRPGFNAIYNKVDNITSSLVTPTVTGDATWTPTNRFQLMAYGNFRSLSAPASKYSPVLIRVSELMWTEGNPFLKSTSFWAGGLQMFYLPADILSLSATMGYEKIINPYITTYSSASQELGGLVMTSINTSPQESWKISPNISFNAFSHKLNLNVSPGFCHWIGRPYGNKTHCNTWNISSSVDYALRNCRFSLNYTAPYKSQTWGGLGTVKSDGEMNFSFTWGNGNFYLMASLNNILNKKTRVVTDEASGNYKTHEIFSQTGRSGMIRLSYTFGYGKKMNENLNLAPAEKIETSVLDKGLKF